MSLQRTLVSRIAEFSLCEFHDHMRNQPHFNFSSPILLLDGPHFDQRHDQGPAILPGQELGLQSLGQRLR